MDWDGRTNTYISVNPVIFSDATVLYIIICYLEACFCCLTVVPTWIFLRALSHSFWPGAAVIQVFSRLFMLSVTALDKKKTLYISASQKCKKYYNIRPAFMLLIMCKPVTFWLSEVCKAFYLQNKQYIFSWEIRPRYDWSQARTLMTWF